MTEEYKNCLTDILTFTGGKRLLNISEVSRYTGLCRAKAKRVFPFVDGRICATTLAGKISGVGR